MNKMIVLDMDGTLFDLYNVTNWLEKIRAEDESPYLEAEPMVNMEEFKRLLIQAQLKGIGACVVSWAAKDSSKEYYNKVRRAKLKVLEEYGLTDLLEEIHIVNYGKPKTRYVTAPCPQILFDDNPEILSHWERYRGTAIDVTKNDIIKELEKITAWA